VKTDYDGMTELEHGGGFIGYRSNFASEKKLPVFELCDFFLDNASESDGSYAKKSLISF
jgi:hypothetical protein